MENVSAQPFDRVAILGFGLIGSSLARMLRRLYPDCRIVAGDANAGVCEQALALGLADEAATDLGSCVRSADLVILSMPVGACGAVARSIAGDLKPGAIVTDVGSVKEMVITTVAPHIPAHSHFVPAHPIAGTEKSGPEAGFAELFTGRWCILTPLPGTPQAVIDKVADLWRAMGAKIDFMEPRRHDLVLGITSHLPHLVAYSIVDTAVNLEAHTKDEVIKYSAGGFRDFTRIAGSDPTMWRDVFLNNRDAVLDILQRFTEDLTILQKAIRNGDGDTLFDVFSRTRAIRRGVIEAGQAVPPAPPATGPSSVPAAESESEPAPDIPRRSAS